MTANGERNVWDAVARKWLCRHTGIAPDHLHITRLKGATSSSVFLIESAIRPHTPRFVLRVLDNSKWLAEEPDLAAHEAAALEEAARTDVPSPEVVAFSADDQGFVAPVVLMTHLPGGVELAPDDPAQWLSQIAAQLAALHRHQAPRFQWHYSSWVPQPAPLPPGWTGVPQLWEQALEIVAGAPPDHRLVFIHRDYHPTNILWQQGAVSGVVDWINACRGPAGVDVATCRINLALMLGTQAADDFLAAYTRCADGFEYHHYWDLDSILDSCLPEPHFYPPWQEFGLSVIAPDILRHRLDGYLQSVMRRI